MTEKLQIVVWDVQHGHATYIATPGGQHIAMDLGTGSYSDSNLEFSPLLHLNNEWGVAQLDGVLVTHPHRDHLDDVFQFDRLNPRVFMRPRHLNEGDIRGGNREEDEDIIEKYLEIDGRYTGGIVAGEDPFDADNNGGALFESFIPLSCATSNLNNHSIVTVISYADSKIIIPGDNEPASWNELLDQSVFVSAVRGTDILLAPHHGRDSGFSEALFEHISPYLTIISDGPCDTTASDKYHSRSRGWTVNKRSGGQENRKCITTRKDGVIYVEFWKKEDGTPIMGVTID